MLRRHFILLAVLALAACGKPETPSVTPPDSPVVPDPPVVEDQDVLLQLSLSFPGNMSSQTTDFPASKADAVQLRHSVRIFRAGESGGWESAPEWQKVITSDKLDSPDTEISADLKQHRYKVLVWTDFVRGSADWFWSAGDFSKVQLQGSYQGASEYKKAFYGSKEVDLTSSGTSANSRVSMELPVAAYRIIATDGSDFEGKTITATITYPEPVPAVFNLWEGAAVDARSGLSFSVPVEALPDGTVSIGSDILLMSGAEASVPVQLRLQGADGSVLLDQAVSIPLKKGRETVLRGELLSAGASSGITLDPSFEGEYDISF